MAEEPWRDEETLRKLYFGEGLTQKEIGKKLGCSPANICRWFRKLDIEAQVSLNNSKANLSKQDQQILFDKHRLEFLYWGEDMRTRDISKDLDCSHKAVLAWLKNHDIEIRDKYDARHKTGEDAYEYTGGTIRYYGPNWPEQKEARLEMDDYECVVCGKSQEEILESGDKDGLQVHHINKLKNFVDGDNVDFERANRIENLLSLCRQCHNRWEGVPLSPDF